jgi:hypothetical protein
MNDLMNQLDRESLDGDNILKDKMLSLFHGLYD